MKKLFHTIKTNFLTRLDIYFYKEIAPNYLFGILFFTFILMLNELFFLLKYYIEYNVPLNQVMLMLANLFPFLMSYSFPFAALPAYLLSMGRFSQDSEIIAMKSCGVSTFRIVRPGLLLGIFLSVFAFFFNNFVVAPANFNYIRIRAKVMSQKPAVEVKERSFMSLGGLKISFDRMETLDHSDVLYRVHVVDIQGRRTIKADYGRIFSDPEDPEHYIIKLKNGNMSEIIRDVEDTKEKEKQDHFFVSYFDYLAMNARINLPRDVYAKGASTMNVWELKERIETRLAPSKKQIENIRNKIKKLRKEYRNNQKKLIAPKKGDSDETVRLKRRNKSLLMEIKRQKENIKKIKKSFPKHELMKFHENFALPLASFFFALLSLSIGMFSARSGRGEGLGLSVIIMLIYYGSKVGVENLILKGVFPPYAEWLNSIVFFVAGSAMLIKKVRE